MRSSLMRQFMGEALLVAFLSVTVAVGIIILVLPQFNQLTGKHITMPFGNVSFWLSIAALLCNNRFHLRQLSRTLFIVFQPGACVKGHIKNWEECFMVSQRARCISIHAFHRFDHRDNCGKSTG